MKKFKVYSPNLRVGIDTPFTVTAENEEEAAQIVAKHMWGSPSDYVTEELK